jgi:probable F420-dependent oxidoreductase
MAYRVGVQIPPQGASYAELRNAWLVAERLGADTVWSWDHFFPLWGDPEGPHFEGWTLLTAMAVATERVDLGVLVTANSYRNSNLLADIARTVDHVSNGRLLLGLGAGWNQRDHREYGYDFGTRGSRVRELAAALPVIRERLARLNPPPVRGSIPLVLGGGGERRFLRLVAEHADEWNYAGRADQFARKAKILERHCEEIGRDPAEIARSVLLPEPAAAAHADDYAESGATHVIGTVAAPKFDFGKIEELLAWRDAANRGIAS